MGSGACVRTPEPELPVAARGVRARRADRARALYLGIAALALAQNSCLLPVRFAPALEGRLIDATSGEPLADALVVVRFDARYDDVLPERHELGHREARTDASGHFRVGPLVRPGLMAWPLLKTGARLEAALAAGYLCPAPRPLRTDMANRIPLRRAGDASQRRDSCRPLAARPGEAEAYAVAWRALHASAPPSAAQPEDPNLELMLGARSALGFGANCEGPVLDLALSPDGRRAAFLADGRRAAEVHLVELEGDRPGSRLVARRSASPRPRLGWAGPDALVVWRPAIPGPAASAPELEAVQRYEQVWSATGRFEQAPPLDPEDLNDADDTRWLGRSFALRRSLDPVTGRVRDHLQVVQPGGRRDELLLPGEACGPRGRFGRPHHRITADGRSALDLRFVEAGCHALRIDLETGRWSTLDALGGAALCREARRVPAAHFGVALRGYTREVEAALADAGAEPSSAYRIRIEPDGATLVDVQGPRGHTRSLPVPRFPLHTPLRRIDVSVVGSALPALPARRETPAALGDPEPL